MSGFLARKHIKPFHLSIITHLCPSGYRSIPICDEPSLLLTKVLIVRFPCPKAYQAFSFWDHPPFRSVGIQPLPLLTKGYNIDLCFCFTGVLFGMLCCCVLLCYRTVLLHLYNASLFCSSALQQCLPLALLPLPPLLILNWSQPHYFFMSFEPNVVSDVQCGQGVFFKGAN